MTPTIEAVQRQHEDALLALPNVSGVGIGEKGGKPVLKVLVTVKVPLSDLAPDQVIPSTLGGFDVDVEEFGEAEAQ